MSNQGKQLIKYVLPMVLCNCAFFLFTIVDGIFVGRGVGTDALGAVNIVMPYVMALNALIMLTSIGGVTVTAIRLGRGDTPGANQAFMHGMTGTAVISVFMCVAGTCLTEPVARLLGANDAYLPMVKEYLFWYAAFAIPFGIYNGLNHFCRNDGSPVLVSVGSMISTGANIFLDWLFVFPLHMGLKGAAIATGISQIIGFFIVSTHYIRQKGVLRIRRFSFDPALMKKILGRGLPESVAQLAMPIATLCTNYVLLARLGGIAVNAFSIICYVASFSIAIFFGTAEGLQPLIGQSYGAKNEHDLKYYFHAGLVINFVGSILISVLLIFVGGGVCALFGADGETLRYTVDALPRYGWGFIVMSLNSMISAYLYSTKRTKEALIMNVSRSLVFDTVIILLLPAVFGGEAVWYTMGAYEMASLILALALLIRSEEHGVVYR